MEDVPRAVETLSAAFADYAWLRHTVARDRHAERVSELERLFVEHVGLRHGRVWVGDDGDAVAVWTHPDTDVAAAFGAIAPRMRELAGDRAEYAERAAAALAPHRPTEPVWFLGSLGVRPEAQGKGIGGAIVQPGLRAAEEAGVPAFLETSEERNVRFYRKLGFEVTAEVTIPDGGPTTWCMRR
ncbi:GNAT family N-acetyltransferase [Kutzneria viridogrisea]